MRALRAYWVNVRSCDGSGRRRRSSSLVFLTSRPGGTSRRLTETQNAGAAAFFVRRAGSPLTRRSRYRTVPLGRDFAHVCAPGPFGLFNSLVATHQTNLRLRSRHLHGSRQRLPLASCLERLVHRSPLDFIVSFRADLGRSSADLRQTERSERSRIPRPEHSRRYAQTPQWRDVADQRFRLQTGERRCDDL